MLESPESDVVTAVRVSKSFGSLLAVNSLSLNVPKGSVYGLIGSNGAGKTTTFSMIVTLLAPDAGWLSVLGHSTMEQPREVHRILGFMPDVLGNYDNITVEEYLYFFAAAYKVPAKARSSLIESLLELVALEDKRAFDVTSLSRGMKQRLSLARALVHDPEVLVLDEPASGLDPRARAELRDLIAQLAEMGKTIVISSHILSELEDICTHVAIMQSGKIMASGKMSEVIEKLTNDNVSGLGSLRRLKVRYADGSVEHLTAHDDEEQAALLQKLVSEEKRTVLEITRVGTGLEEAYLNLTREDDPAFEQNSYGESTQI